MIYLWSIDSISNMTVSDEAWAYTSANAENFVSQVAYAPFRRNTSESNLIKAPPFKFAMFRN